MGKKVRERQRGGWMLRGEEEARTNMVESGTQWPGQLLALANSASEGVLCLTSQPMTATHEVCAQC